MSYNVTLAADQTVVDFFLKANQFSGTLYAAGISVGLFILMISLLYRSENIQFSGALTMSAFATFILTFVGMMAGLVDFYLVIGFGTIVAFGVLYMYLEGK